MTNEEFQTIVLEALGELRLGQKALEARLTAIEQRQTALEERQTKLEEGQTKLEERQIALEERQTALEQGQKSLQKELNAIKEQTAWLTEYKTKTDGKVDNVVSDNEAIKDIIGRHEVEIKKLKKKVG